MEQHRLYGILQSDLSMQPSQRHCLFVFFGRLHNIVPPWEYSIFREAKPQISTSLVLIAGRLCHLDSITIIGSTIQMRCWFFFVGFPFRLLPFLNFSARSYNAWYPYILLTRDIYYLFEFFSTLLQNECQRIRHRFLSHSWYEKSINHCICIIYIILI